jgi:hypothetical protein
MKTATSIVWTAANLVMFAAFAMSVIVQINDPDPWLWMAIYAAASTLCVVEIKRATRPLFPALMIGATVAWAMTVLPRVRASGARFSDMFAEFEMKNVAVEESREMYGLLLIALWMAAIAIAAWRRSAQRA